MGLGEKVKLRRERLGWSQNQLAKVAGIPQPTIWRLEKGEIDHPKANTLVALANALAVPVDYLLQEDYEILSPDMIRADPDLRAMVGAYASLSEEDRRIVKGVAQYLTGKEPGREQQRYVSHAVKVRRVRKE